MPQAAVKPAVICEYGTVPVNNFRNDNSNPSRANGIARKRLFPYGYFARLYPSGCIASRLAQAGKQRARDFDYMLVEMGCEEIRGVPELLAYQRNGVGKGWLRFAVPSGLANGEFSRTRQAMSQQSNDGEQAEQHRCCAGNRQA